MALRPAGERCVGGEFNDDRFDQGQLCDGVLELNRSTAMDLGRPRVFAARSDAVEVLQAATLVRELMSCTGRRETTAHPLRGVTSFKRSHERIGLQSVGCEEPGGYIVIGNVDRRYSWASWTSCW